MPRQERTQKYRVDSTILRIAIKVNWVQQIIKQHNQETEGHSQRVAQMTIELARRLGIEGTRLKYIFYGALLHDIGKICIPDSVLLKPGPLTECEWKIMRRHPGYAVHLLKPIVALRPSIYIPYCHHEKWDGSGYPRGLKGEEIPLEARIFAIIDVWDALVNNRIYRPAWSEEKALQYLYQQNGKHFDPKMTAVFMEFLRGC